MKYFSNLVRLYKPSLRNRKLLPFVFMLLGLGFFGCNSFVSKKNADENVARMDQIYLNRTELSANLPKGLSPDDSTAFTHNYINRWATKQLLLQKAKQNLPTEQQQKFEAMINDYRQELYTEAYKKMYLQRHMDTAVTKEEIEHYFTQNEQKYKLDRDIVKLRYIKLPKDFEDIDKVKKRLQRFDNRDRAVLEDQASLSDSYYLNDSLWLVAKNVTTILEDQNLAVDNKKYLKKGNFIEVNDSISLYLIYIKDVRLRDEDAPRSFLMPRIKRIILNRRKLEFEKELEKRILDDALEHNRFETYP